MSILRSNRGVTLIFVALGMFLFLLFLGVAVDTGWMVFVRSQGQARIDSAALASIGALVENLGASDRETRAEVLANTFSDKNSVVNSTVDPANVVTPMRYDHENGNLTEASGWELWSGNGPNCNAVRITTTVPTPMFFSGIRSVFGADENGQTNIAVGATSHLPCPGVKVTTEGLGPFALRQCAWVEGNLEGPCPIARDVFDVNTEEGFPALAKWAVTAPVQINDSISFPSTIFSESDFSPYLCSAGGKITVPVVNAVSGGEDPCSDESTSGTVVGFATICFSQQTIVDEKTEPPTIIRRILATLQCGEIAKSSAGTGECYGTFASNPILVR